MATVPYPHSPADRHSGNFSMLKTVLFYLLLAGVAMAIAIPAAFVTIGAQ